MRSGIPTPLRHIGVALVVGLLSGTSVQAQDGSKKGGCPKTETGATCPPGTVRIAVIVGDGRKISLGIPEGGAMLRAPGAREGIVIKATRIDGRTPTLHFSSESSRSVVRHSVEVAPGSQVEVTSAQIGADLLPLERGPLKVSVVEAA